MFLLLDVHSEIYFEEVDNTTGEKFGAYRYPFSLSWQRPNLKKNRKTYIKLLDRAVFQLSVESNWTIDVLV